MSTVIAKAGFCVFYTATGPELGPGVKKHTVHRLRRRPGSQRLRRAARTYGTTGEHKISISLWRSGQGRVGTTVERFPFSACSVLLVLSQLIITSEALPLVEAR